ncbi:MAG: glycosyltransferase family 4 protein [Pyrinomonadaceae bacterium]
MKFCMVSTFYPPYNFGGDGMHIYRLSNALARRGHSVDVFHCEDAFLLLNGEQPFGDFPNHPLVTVHKLKSNKGLLSPLLTQQTGAPVFKPQLKKALEENAYDVIHYHNMSLIGIKALSYGNAIKLYTTHEHWLVCPMHVLWKFNREVCTKKSCFSCQLVGKRPPQLWRHTGLMGRMLKHIDCFLSPSRFTLQKHLDEGLDIPIRQMPHFLPTPPDDEGDPVGPADIKPYFLFVGRLEVVKGVQNLIPAFRKAPQYDLLIAGEGAYGHELMTQARDSPNIKFLGPVSQEHLRSLYRSARAAIVPSICYETFGIVVIEAFAHRTPVIVNHLGALPELVEESGGGFTFRNIDELTYAVAKLGDDSSLRDDLGQNGYEAYLKSWTTDAHLGQYLDLIEEIRHESAS